MHDQVYKSARGPHGKQNALTCLSVTCRPPASAVLHQQMARPNLTLGSCPILRLFNIFESRKTTDLLIRKIGGGFPSGLLCNGIEEVRHAARVGHADLPSFGRLLVQGWCVSTQEIYLGRETHHGGVG